MRRDDSTRTEADSAAARLFYDGDCGFCHGVVRFVVKRDRERHFRFAPIDGATFLEVVPEELRPALPDSVLLVLPGGKVLLRSDAAIAVMSRLPGPWPASGAILRRVPRPLRELGYRMVAAVRRRLFRAPAESCPLLPAEQRALFDP